MKIELVVFDMAGTTLNDPGGVNTCFRDALAAAGLAVSVADANAVMGLPKREAVRRLIAPSARAAELLPRVDAIHADFVERMRRFYATDASVYEIPGTSATFAALRRAGIKIGLNTGFSRDIVDVILEQLGWHESETIDAVVASDEVARGRPHPDMIQHLMRRLGVREAARVAKVGDTPADLQEGASAGCGLVVGVTGGTHTREQLAGQPHTHLIETVADLPALLGL
jgi:phosphonatase-like hydrolase